MTLPTGGWKLTCASDLNATMTAGATSIWNLIPFDTREESFRLKTVTSSKSPVGMDGSRRRMRVWRAQQQWPWKPHYISATSHSGTRDGAGWMESEEADQVRDTLLPRAVRVGGMDKRELLQALRDQKVQLNQAGEALFEDRRFTTLRQKKVIEIACLSVADLGFVEGATYQQLTARALESGLVECPLELGPYLRLQLLDQPEGSAGVPATKHRAPPGSITIASSPLDDCEETPKGFYLRRIDAVLWLRGYWSWPGHIWSPEDVLVFSRDGSPATPVRRRLARGWSGPLESNGSATGR
jgi:hypothetical protein